MKKINADLTEALEVIQTANAKTGEAHAASEVPPQS